MQAGNRGVEAKRFRELRPKARPARSLLRLLPSLGQPPKEGFLAGPFYDLVFFIGAPLLSLALIGLVVSRGWHSLSMAVAGRDVAIAAFFISTWTYAHLVAVVFRSHLNPTVFNRFRLRMVVVPIALFLGLMVSSRLMVAAFVLAAFWDVYHTSMQNFGLGRLYDMKRGNDARAGRKLDIWMNHLVYIGPIFFGANLLPTLEPLARFERVGWTLPMQFGDLVLSFQHVLASSVLVLGLGFLALYLIAYGRLVREQGYRLSWQKLALLGSTAVTSTFAWGWLPPFEAFFAVNFFHALQYFGIVWWIERRTIEQRMGFRRLATGTGLALFAYVLILVALGVGYAVGNLTGLRWALALGLVVSLMHFWYDGFIWSVRRREVSV